MARRDKLGRKRHQNNPTVPSSSPGLTYGLGILGTQIDSWYCHTIGDDGLYVQIGNPTSIANSNWSITINGGTGGWNNGVAGNSNILSNQGKFVILWQ